MEVLQDNAEEMRLVKNASYPAMTQLLTKYNIQQHYLKMCLINQLRTLKEEQTSDSEAAFLVTESYLKLPAEQLSVTRYRYKSNHLKGKIKGPATGSGAKI